MKAVKLAKERGNKIVSEELEISSGIIDDWISKVRRGKLDIGEGSR